MAKQEEGKKKKGAAPAVEAAPAGKPSRPKLNNEASARLRHKYQKEVVPSLMKELGLKNVMAVPRLEKVVDFFGLVILALLDPTCNRGFALD